MKKQASQTEETKIRKLLVIRFGKNKGCVWESLGNEAGETGRDQVIEGR